MNLIVPEEGETVVTNVSRRKDDVLRIVVTDGTTEMTLAFLHRILSVNSFGPDQSVFISIYEFPEKAVFLESIAIELTAFSPNILHGINYCFDASVAFKDADVVVCIGTARGYMFTENDYNDLFFKDYVRAAKFYGECIEKYAKRDAKIIVLGGTAATIISRYATSIPIKNITALSMFNRKIAAAHIAARANCHPADIKNIIIWGSNNRYNFPDCGYMYFADGRPLTDELIVWLKTDLPGILRKITHRPRYVRSTACCLADHCDILWNGTPENEWACMGVLSDHSYGIRAGIFFSYPVFCRNGQYEIVQGLAIDEYVKRYILDLSRLIARDVTAARALCD
ncbi:malate dehydrogenase-like [Colletes gigas]|uniref:malate dehydrogenase-like n=1 Tax=Colletes gigas TaxID=935657 RepID=UPI001C9B5B35|nr:malate dehydrogenase-like [Colletes gigas]